MPVRFTAQKLIGRKSIGESIEGTGQDYDVSVVDYEGHNVGNWLNA